MLRKEVLDMLEVNCDYYLSQYTIRKELNLNQEFYDYTDLDKLYIETRLKSIEKYLKIKSIDYETELYLNRYCYDSDKIYLVINHEGALINITINREQFINDEIEFIFDLVDEEINLD